MGPVTQDVYVTFSLTYGLQRSGKSDNTPTVYVNNSALTTLQTGSGKNITNLFIVPLRKGDKLAITGGLTYAESIKFFSVK